MNMAKSLHQNPSEIQSRKIQLPPTKKKTIILDLDETLIHCTQLRPGQVQIPIVTQTGIHVNVNTPLF